MISLQVVHVNSGQSVHDQIAFYTFHSFLVGVPKNTGYIHAVHT